MEAITSTPQWLRKCTLLIADDTGKGVDLSQLQCRFSVSGGINQTLGTLNCRVYNVSQDIVGQIANEFTRVKLSAGYQNSPFGILFQGTITQIRVGRENALDSYVDLVAYEGDDFYNWGYVSFSLAAGASDQQTLDQLLTALKPYGIIAGDIPPQSTKKAPRGQALHLSLKDALRDFAAGQDCAYNIRNGRLNLVSLLKAEAINVTVLQPSSGLLGAPEQTVDGINCECLLNPNLDPGALISIPQKYITTTSIRSPITADEISAKTYLEPLSPDALYQIYHRVHEGDTRGETWRTVMQTASVDATTGMMIQPPVRFIEQTGVTG